MKLRTFVTLSMFLWSFIAYAQEYFNMYPNYQPGAENYIQYITNAGYGISRGEISPVMPLEVNGDGRQGTVLSKWPSHNDADIDLYEIKVLKEGVLSIVANPISYDEKGSLRLHVYVNDYRREGAKAFRRLGAKSYDKYLRDDGWSVTDSYSFYAYPGTYYLTVDGKFGEDAGKYLPLTYQVRVIQDDNVNSYSGNLGKDSGPYNPNVSTGCPNDLGETALNNNSIDIVSSLDLENWVRRADGNLQAKKTAHTYTNSRDEFWFIPSVSGKVYVNLTSFSSDAMNVWQRAWKKFFKEELSEYPLLSVSVLHKGVKSYQLVKKQSNFEGSIDVVAGGQYKVTISSLNHRPAYYRLYMSYSEKVPPVNIGANNNQSTVDIYENIDIFEASLENNNPDAGAINDRIELFDTSTNETRNNELNGIWGNNYVAFQIESNNASLYQTTDINFWQNYNIDKGGLILKNIQKNGNNTWQCDVMWLFPNTPYVLWMAGIIEMNNDGNAITIIKKNPCDGSLSYQTLNRQIN
jgi:hypothetical protein